MKPRRLGTPIFVYDDYVDYLREWYSYARRFGVTQKDVQKKAGVNAQSFLSDVLSERKKIGNKHISGFVEALELSADEAEYFSLLVRKKNARDPGEINVINGKLAALRAKKTSAILTGGGTLEYFSSWKYPLIREYIKARGTVRSPEEISAAFLHLKLGLAETRRALQKLLKWDLIAYDESTGRYRPINDNRITYAEMPHAVVNDVKRAFIESSLYAMENLPKNTRHVSLAIRGINRETYDALCLKIDALRNEFLESAQGSGKADHVYTLLVQLFPVMNIDPGSVNETRPQ